MEGQAPKYLTTMTFEHIEATDIDGARMEADKLFECAREKGLRIVEGQTHVARERDALEVFYWGSEDILRNRKAERGELLTSTA